jgi:hypothetical protein
VPSPGIHQNVNKNQSTKGLTHISVMKKRQ